ncbi:MAG: hypothetical protein K8R59_08690 [Thermoanaerobaculales bacterium]|nr:hypothetical protein [Thermoanaerobaculales bacterium]
MSDVVNLTCPHCGSALKVDVKAGVIVSHEAPPEQKEKIDLDQRIDQLKTDQQRAAGKMDEALRKEKDRSRLMEDRFAELMKGAVEKDDGSRPVREIDLD